MDVSIIIVNWNTRYILHDCLASISAQTKDIEFEVVVVDNASIDGSAEMVKSLFPSVILILNSENRGFAAANNQGIAIAKGRYVCLVNSDIIIFENCIKNLVLFMDGHPCIGIVHPRILNPDHTFRPTCRNYPSIWNNLCQVFGLAQIFSESPFFSDSLMNYWKHDSMRSVDVVSGSFMMVRRKALDEVGLLDEDFFIYGEDIDWCKRFHIAGWDVVFYPGAAAIHVGGASSRNAPVRFYIEMQKADLRYWRKHHGRLGQSAYWMIILLRQLVRLPGYILIYVFRPEIRGDAIFKLKRALTCIRWLFTCLGGKI